jgi:branched-chain amino acid transport system substrate-binding protein
VGYVLLSPEQKRALGEREAMLQKARRLPQDKALALREEARALTAENGEPIPPIVDFDALFIPESHEKVVLIAPQLAFHEVVGTRLLGPSGWYDPELVAIGRHHVEGAVFTAPFFPGSELPSVQDFEARYLETYGEPPEPFAAQGYDAATLALMQLSQGRHSRDAMRRGLLAVHGFPGVTGVLTMRADGNARKRPFLLSVEHGEIIQVE